jgi:hypothetical protein
MAPQLFFSNQQITAGSQIFFFSDRRYNGRQDVPIRLLPAVSSACGEYAGVPE